MKKIALDLAELKENYLDKNLTLEQLAQKYGCSVSVIQRELKRAGATKVESISKNRGGGKGSGRAFNSEEELVELYITKNLSAIEIARLKGITCEGVQKYLKKWNIKKDRQKATEAQQRGFEQKHGVKNAGLVEEFRDKASKTYRENHPKVEKPKKEQPKPDFRLNKQVGEELVSDFLGSLGIKCERARTVIPPYELDIYCPDYGIAVEYNGLNWHGENKVSQNYHKNKSVLCEKNGVFLYHIFEYEWADLNVRERIKSQLKNLFGKNERVVYARTCEIREVSNDLKREFLEKNHIQGNDRSLIKLGLFRGDELLSLMTFLKPRFNHKYDWELSRFCSLSGTNVVGGASKLFKHFLESNEGSIISYSDATKTRGTLYEKLGFKFLRHSPPNYVWTDGHEILSRYKTQMKNEIETMKSKGYYRIFDSGNKVWVYER